MLKRKMALLIAAILILSLAISGCGGSKPAVESKPAAAESKPASSPAEQPKAPEKIVMKVSSVLTNETPQNMSMKFFADIVKEKTKGQIEVQIFPSSQLGEQRDGLEGLKVGTLEMLLTASGPLAQFVPSVDVVSLPYIFKGLDHMHKAVDGEPGKLLEKDIENAGFKLLYWMDSGTRNVINNVRPITKPDDLKGLKVRVMTSKLMTDTLNSMGAIATPMGQGEVYSALQQKVLDGWENNPITLLTLKLYEVSKYFSYTQHFTTPDAMLISKKIYDKLTPEQQKIIMDAAKQAQVKERELWSANEGKAVTELKAKGVIFNDVPDLQPFVEKVKPVWKTYTDKHGTKIVDMIQNIK